MTKGEKLFHAWLLLSLLWAALVLNQPAAPVAALVMPPFLVLVGSWFGMWVWKYVGASHWARVPANVRRGVLRAYLAVSIPWILWFAYKISYDVGHSYRRRYVEGDFLWLASLPLGALILFLVGSWIIDGFRSPAPGIGILPDSEIAPANEHDQGDASKDANAIFSKLDFLLRNESAQNDRLPEPYRSKLYCGVACDEIAGASGEFGRSIRNPIPVNGPLGELIYLSNLRVADSQQSIMFHRLGSILDIDVFETASLDGKVWDFLFLDLYHPRKSRRAPIGYEISDQTRGTLPLGTNEFVAQFPEELPDAIALACERWIGLRLRPPEIQKAIERSNFSRPADHQSRYEYLVKLTSSKVSSRSPVDFIEVGITLGKALLNPDDCWADVCKLRGYDVPDAVATCEMAFARAAVVKHTVKWAEEDDAGKKIDAGVEKFIEEAFENEEQTEEVLAYYENEKLSVVAPRVVRFYEQNAVPLTRRRIHSTATRTP